MRVVVDNGPGRKRRASSGRALKAAKPQIAIRPAIVADAPALHALIAAHLEEGRLLPRALDELAVHAPRFVVAVESSSSGERIVGCAELAPLSQAVAEVRSLVVGRDARRHGLGVRMVEDLAARARREGYARLCAFAHDPAFFVRRGFSIVPHTWVPEKIAHDCFSCPLFRNCGQYAIVLELDRMSATSPLRRTANVQ
ncbi:MAG TPA: GNAT family N-acetyltransferase [Vicinamibacterales bacterium]|nr:GNAT family N-acetyltransferase [Vicinamibacterales bacterium]